MTPMDIDLLKRVTLFSKLDDTKLTALARLLKPRVANAAQPIFWIGEKGDEFLIIQSGQVIISYPDSAGREEMLAVLGPGDFFGEISLMDGGPRTASARAKTDCQLLCVDRDSFHDFLRRHPEAAIEIIGVLGRRQREVLNKLRGVPNANAIIQERSTLWQRIADTIAAISANQYFVMLHVFWFATWITLNFSRGSNGFDPFPFGLLTLIVSLEAIFLSIFVLISQNRQSEKDKITTDLDYQVNLRAHFEIMQLHQKMDRLLAGASPAPAAAVAPGRAVSSQA